MLILNRGLNVAAEPKLGTISKLPNGQTSTGPLGPVSYLATLRESDIVLWNTETMKQSDGTVKIEYRPKMTTGADVLRPGNLPSFKGVRGNDLLPKLNFLSLMLALFCGTASLPHILIRYYTVKDQAAARKSTVVGIAAASASSTC